MGSGVGRIILCIICAAQKLRNNWTLCHDNVPCHSHLPCREAVSGEELKFNHQQNTKLAPTAIPKVVFLR
jgi:hypothetical protein